MLHVHRAERADGLVEGLRGLLSAPLPEPFAPEVVVVPTRGMERWLAQRLSLRLGICANVDFAPARALVSDVVAAASGVDPTEDPWRPERLVWALLDVIDESVGEVWAAPLAHHLSGHPARRLATAGNLAHLFGRYGLHRPDMVGRWAAGAEDHWQAKLWRRARDRLAVRSPAERLAGACSAVEADPEVVDLPSRVSLFGLTRLPAGDLRVLRALATARAVHLFLLHPSPALWQKLDGHGPVARRREDDTASTPANRLLASWGRDAREMQLVLAGADRLEHHHPAGHPPRATLLGRLQADVCADRVPALEPLAPGDASIRIHACHGRSRQVEVLRDQILHLLSEDQSLEPRDVIVMCPDIEAFAPLIQATFGAGEAVADDDFEALPAELPPPDLRVRLADRALRQTNPVLGVMARLLELAGERMTASQVLDLCDREPVRQRFGFDDDAIARMERWVAASGIRWGLDAEHRRSYRLQGLDAGTWRKGLDRLLVGVAMTEDEQRRFAGAVLPLDDVDSGAIELAGRLAELVDRLQTVIDSFGRRQPIGAWAASLARAAEALTQTRPHEAWQRAELQRMLDDVVSEAGESAAELSPAELRGLLGERLRGRPTRANFRTGHLTVCTLHPMRSVPHRVVCLLGLDDCAFPRRAPRDGDDLMLAAPLVGERDARAEDRQMLLDALMAAEDKLIVTYSGNDERTNAPRPPAVPVGELLDVIERTAGFEAREQVQVRHPLQPFDPRNFDGARPWSFDHVTLRGARALTGPRRLPPPLLAAPLPDPGGQAIELEDLVRFVEHPVKAFLRQRLGVSLGRYDDEVADHLPVELDALGRWGVGDRLLQARLRGVGERAACLAEIARGTLPPGRLARPVLEEAYPAVEAIAAEAQRRVPPRATPESLEVRALLPDGRALTGSVPGVLDDTVRAVMFSQLAPKHRLAAWVRLLALTIARPRGTFTAVTVGRGGRGVAVATLGTIEPDEALEQLLALVRLFDEGMREPVPIFCRTSAAQAAGGNPRTEWESGYDSDREDREPEHVLVLGGRVPFAQISADPRFPLYARRLWAGLLAHERLERA